MPVNMAENLAAIQRRIASACERVGRNPESVKLVAVAKGVPAQRLSGLIAAGHARIGESYVQEFLSHREAVGEQAQWHFIGRIQSNKIKYLVGRTGLVHSVDRAKLLDEFERRAAAAGVTVDCLLEVNVGDEDSKGGTSTDAALGLLRHALGLAHVRVHGLMAIPPFLDEAEAMRPYHRRLASLRDELQAACGVALPELSMGMSLDLEVAIEEGATLVRVGTDLFGPRTYTSSERN